MFCAWVMDTKLSIVQIKNSLQDGEDDTCEDDTHEKQKEEELAE